MYYEAYVTLPDGDLILFIANRIFQVSYKKTAVTKSHLLKCFLWILNQIEVLFH